MIGMMYLKGKYNLILINILASILVFVPLCSYAYFNKTIVYKDVNLVVGTLDYDLKSSAIDKNYQVVVPQNTDVKINVEIKELNSITSKYQLYYECDNSYCDDLIVGYSSDSSYLPSGKIKSGESLIIKLVIKNASDDIKKIKIGVAGGFDKYEIDDIIINSNQIKINQEITDSFQEDKIYIDSIECLNDSLGESTMLITSKNTIFSNITLSKTDKSSSVTYLVDVINQDQFDYYFAGINIESDSYSNELITYRLENIADDEVIKSKTSKTFKIIFYYKDSVSSDNNSLLTNLELVLNYRPIEGDVYEIDSISYEDTKSFIDFTSSGFESLYGDGSVLYSDGSYVFKDGGGILYKDITNLGLFSDYISASFTIQAEVMQENNSSIYPVSIFFTGQGDGKKSSEIVTWLGLYKGYLQIYTYWDGSELYTNNASSLVKKAFLSYDMSKYDDRIVNIQLVSSRVGNTFVYINGNLVSSFESGEKNNSSSYITIGDLRPMRGLKYEGKIYDYSIYNRMLSEEEVKVNWEYAKSKWNILD